VGCIFVANGERSVALKRQVTPQV